MKFFNLSALLTHSHEKLIALIALNVKMIESLHSQNHHPKRMIKKLKKNIRKRWQDLSKTEKSFGYRVKEEYFSYTPTYLLSLNFFFFGRVQRLV